MLVHDLSRLPDPQDVRVTLGKFLEELRQEYAKAKRAKEERRAKAIGERVRHLVYVLEYHTKEASTLEGAQAALAELIELAPDRASDWEAAMQSWQSREAEIQEAARREKEEQEALDRFAEEYAAYARKAEAIAGRNQRVLDALQKELDQPYTAWRLVYGVVAYDDGERVVDVDSAYVMDEPTGKPPVAVRVIRPGGEIAERVFYTPVYSERVELRPTTEGAGTSCYVEGYGHLYGPPTMTRDELRELVDSKMEKLPEPPEPPEGVPGHRVEYTIRQIRSDIPY